MSDAETFTVSEAGFVLELKQSEINRAVDKNVIQARRARGASNRQRTFGQAELRFLRADQQLQKTLTPEGRRQLYAVVAKMPQNAHIAKIGPVAVDFHEVDAHLEKRISLLASVRDAVENRGGEFIIKGTDIPAYQIAALNPSLSVADILEDYPSLTKRQVEAAIDYASAYPKKGRPYPATTMKRALTSLVNLGVFDDDV